MRILVLALVACSSKAAPPPPVAVAAAPSDAAVDAAPPDAPAKELVELSPTQNDLDKAAIRKMVKQHLRAIMDCYERFSPDAIPSVVVRFTIGPEGRVKSSTATGAQADLENCIATLYKGMVFPPRPGGDSLTVTYPLTFRFAGG